MKALTTKKERHDRQMEQLRQVTKTEKILFPIVVTIFVSLMLPSAASAGRLPDARQPVSVSAA